MQHHLRSRSRVARGLRATSCMPLPGRTRGRGKCVRWTMQVDIDGIDTPGDRVTLPPLRVPPHPLFRPPLWPPLSAFSAGPSSSASFPPLPPSRLHIRAPGARVPLGFLWLRVRTWTSSHMGMRRTCRRERGMRRAEWSLHLRLRMPALLDQTHAHHRPLLSIHPRASASSSPSRLCLPKTRKSIFLRMYSRHIMTIRTTTPFSMSALGSRTALRPRAPFPCHSRTRTSRWRRRSRCEPLGSRTRPLGLPSPKQYRASAEHRPLPCRRRSQLHVACCCSSASALGARAVTAAHSSAGTPADRQSGIQKMAGVATGGAKRCRSRRLDPPAIAASTRRPPLLQAAALTRIPKPFGGGTGAKEECCGVPSPTTIGDAPLCICVPTHRAV
ncbi:hypothetical protein B0H19DRAFT_600118 [Mycena capillaripes]|nr:hypothetical protein B0H19DRAFT_600118 [Mycena capillaripes]